MEELFDFSEALRRLKAGEKVTRSIWGGYWMMAHTTARADYIEDRGRNLHMGYTIIAALKEGGYAPAQPYQADLLATDWKVYTK